MVTTQSQHKFYISVARNLLAVGEYRPMAQRYIDVCRRRKTLRRGRSEALRFGTVGNDLSLVKFKPPLSIANCSPRCRLRAVNLIAQGVPIATELDDHGKHRGTSIDELMHSLRKQTGKTYDELEVLYMYRAFLSGHPSLLHIHPLKRFSQIPEFLRRVDFERDALEGRLCQALISRDGRLFACAVHSEVLAEAIIQCSGGVVAGYAGTGSTLRINGKSIPTLWGVGRGLGVLSVSDIRQLCESAPGAEGVVGIECDLGGWHGYPSLEHTLERTSRTNRYTYYEE